MDILAEVFHFLGEIEVIFRSLGHPSGRGDCRSSTAGHLSSGTSSTA